MEWLPIETAPKDDAQFLAYHPYFVNRFWILHGKSNLKGFTHWMPLPQPPKGEK
jgi:hypothetical protein